MLGTAAVVVVCVRPLLGENQTNSFEAGPPAPAASISGPLARFLLGLALVFLAAAIAAVHPRSFLSHSAPFSLSLLYMTGRTTSPETRRAGPRRPRVLHRREPLRVSAFPIRPARLLDIGPIGPPRARC